MSFIESISYYSDSLMIVCVGYLISIKLFSVYNHQLWKRNLFNNIEFKWWQKIFIRIFTIVPVAIIVGIRGFYTGADTHGDRKSVV